MLLHRIEPLHVGNEGAFAEEASDVRVYNDILCLAVELSGNYEAANDDTKPQR